MATKTDITDTRADEFERLMCELDDPHALMTTTTRRAALGTVLAAGAVATVPAAAAVGSSALALSPADQRALDLWKRLRKLLAIRDQLEDEQAAAEARMPDWARPGPRYVFPDGSPSGTEIVTWPMVADLSQEHVFPVSGHILARPRVEDLYAHWQQANTMRAANRGAATQRLTRALAAHAERLKQRDVERERSGYALAEQRIEAAGEAMTAVEDEIGRLEGVLAVAAQLMIEIRIYGNDEDEHVVRLYRASLAAIRPQLIGPIAEDADRVLAKGARRDVV